jgi:PhnB protein
MADDAAKPKTSTDQVLGSVSPYLSVSDARAAAAFYEKAFGAVEVARMVGAPDGRLIHCHLHINGASVMLNDPFPEHGHPHKPMQGVTLVMHVTDIDSCWNRAVEAGCEIAMPLQVMFWGDRYGQLNDPYGVMWALNEPVVKAG